MILVDANVLMYAAGAPHPDKTPSVRLLEQIANGDVVAAIDAPPCGSPRTIARSRPGSPGTARGIPSRWSG
jgi:hypothetical protein